MRQLLPYLLVGIGGFLGANARFIIGTWAGAAFGPKFPFGTFVVNISGSFLLGIVGTLVVDRLVDNPDQLQLLMAIGFLGAYTTFSSFAFENNALLSAGAWWTVALNIILSVAVGLLALRLGVSLARAWF